MKYYRIRCSFIGEMSIVYPSYPVRAAKPSPAKRFAVAALTAVPNPKYRIYVGGRSSHVWYLFIFPFSKTCQSKTRSKGEPWAKGDAATSETCGGAASADQVLHLAVQLKYFWLNLCRHANKIGQSFPNISSFRWHLLAGKLPTMTICKRKDY